MSTYERLLNSQNFFSPYLTQEDLSRFGRDHIVVGQYQEIYFPSKKVRFIALNDGIDTVNSHTTDYAALKKVEVEPMKLL